MWWRRAASPASPTARNARVSSGGAWNVSGLRETGNLFVGTVHGFCLRHLLMPYARLAGLNVPYPIKVTTAREAGEIFRRTGEQLLGIGQPYKPLDVSRHRRVNLDRTDRAWRADPQLARL